MPEQNSSEAVPGVTELDFIIANKKNKHVSFHLPDGETIIEQGAEQITRWLKQQLQQHVQQEFGAGVVYTIFDSKGKSMVAVDILASAIFKNHQQGAVTVQRYGQLSAEGVLQLRLKLSGENAAGPSSGGRKSHSAGSTTTQGATGSTAALNSLWSLVPRFVRHTIEYFMGDDSCTASDWKDVPAGAEIDWHGSKFKGQIISQDRATSEERWLLLEDKVVRAATLMSNNTESELDMRIKFDRRAQQHNKGVENTHRDNRHKQFPLPEKDVPSAGANRKELVGVDTKGQPTGVEAEADKWHAQYGDLYANKDVADPPGSNRFRLPTKLTTLLDTLEAGAAKQGVSTGSRTTESGEVPAVASGRAAQAAPAPTAAAATAPTPATAGAAPANQAQSRLVAPSAAAGQAGSAGAPGTREALQQQQQQQQPGTEGLDDLDNVLDNYLTGLGADNGAPVTDDKGLSPGSSGGSNGATGSRRSPRLVTGGSSVERQQQRQQRDTVPFGPAGPGSLQDQQQQQTQTGQQHAPAADPSAAAAGAVNGQVAAGAAALGAAAVGTGTAAGARVASQHQQQQATPQQQQQLQELKQRIEALRAAGMSEVDIRTSVSATLYDAAMKGTHPTEQQLRRQGGSKMVVAKLQTAAERQAAREGRADAAAGRKTGQKRKASTSSAGSRGQGKKQQTARKKKAQRQQSESEEEADSYETDEDELADEGAAADQGQGGTGQQQQTEGDGTLRNRSGRVIQPHPRYR